MNATHHANNRKKKSSFFSRLTKRQKTKQSTSSRDALDSIPLNIGAATSSRKGSMPIMSIVDSTLPSLQSLSSSQSSMETQSNHEKMQETEDSSSSSSSSKAPKSLYAPCVQTFADMDAEFMESRINRWREEGKAFGDLESSAQFSISMEIDERNVTCTKNIQSHTVPAEANEKVTISTRNHAHVPLNTTLDSAPLPVLSSKQKEMVEPTLFELDSSLLSALSAINLVEESFSDEESQASNDGTQSDCNVETSDLPEDEDLLEEEQDGEDFEEEDEGECEEQSSGAFHLFSFDYLQERLSCISCL